MAQTRSTDLVIPEVWADAIEAKFEGRLVLAPLGFTDNTLTGIPGDTLNFTEWAALTDASDLDEETPMTPERMTATDEGVTIKEAGKAVEFTDKALLNAVGDPLGEGQRQVGITVARKIDRDIVNEIHTAIDSQHENFEETDGDISADVVVDGLAHFGDDWEPQDYVLIIHSGQRAALYKDDQFIDASKFGSEDVIVRGQIGLLYGMPVMVSNIGATQEMDNSFRALIVRRTSPPSQDRGAYGPAYGTIWKRRPIVETDRDILARTTVVATNVHYAVKLLDESGVVVLATNVPS